MKMKLQQKWDEDSSQALVNQERMKNGIPMLVRNKEMDDAARDRAESLLEESMGTAEQVSQVIKAAYRGHVLKGRNVLAVHKTLMEDLVEDGRGKAKATILDPEFDEFGVGIARAPNGSIFICHLFKSRSFSLALL